MRKITQHTPQALTKDGGEVDDSDDPADDLQLLPRQVTHVVSVVSECGRGVKMMFGCIGSEQPVWQQCWNTSGACVNSGDRQRV